MDYQRHRKGGQSIRTRLRFRPLPLPLTQTSINPPQQNPHPLLIQPIIIAPSAHRILHSELVGILFLQGRVDCLVAERAGEVDCKGIKVGVGLRGVEEGVEVGDVGGDLHGSS